MVDDLIAYRISDHEFLLIPNAANCAEVAQRLGRSGLTVSDVTREIAIIAVQGRTPMRWLRNSAFRSSSTCLSGPLKWPAQCTVCRTGYTGERGGDPRPVDAAGTCGVPLCPAAPCRGPAPGTPAHRDGLPAARARVAPRRACEVVVRELGGRPGQGDFVGRAAYVAAEADEKVVGLRSLSGVPRPHMVVTANGREVGA